MKCVYCNHQAGFFNSYHEECKMSVDYTLKQIEIVLNQYISDEIDQKEEKRLIKEIIATYVLFKRYIESQVIDKTAIYQNEVILYAESMLRILESKNRCRMVETGHRYEKKPSWSVTKKLLDNYGRIIFTDKAVYMYVDTQTMRYPYSKIVNYGFDGYAYFDVKTSSPFPHRFYFIDTNNSKDNYNIKMINLFLNGLC